MERNIPVLDSIMYQEHENLSDLNQLSVGMEYAYLRRGSLNVILIVMRCLRERLLILCPGKEGGIRNRGTGAGNGTGPWPRK